LRSSAEQPNMSTRSTTPRASATPSGCASSPGAATSRSELFCAHDPGVRCNACRQPARTGQVARVARASRSVRAVSRPPTNTSPRSTAAYFCAIGLRLSFHRRRQLVAARQPVALDDLKTAGSVRRARASSWPPRRPPATAAVTTLVVRERLERRVHRSPASPAHAGAKVRGRGTISSQCCTRVASPMAARLPDQRRGALQRRLDVRRRHVLARRADDQLLLAVDDLQVAVVDRTRQMFARAQPPSSVGNGLLRLLRLVCGSPPSRRLT